MKLKVKHIFKQVSIILSFPSLIIVDKLFLGHLLVRWGLEDPRRAVGRGEGSKKGGTSTRGHKGAKSRSGYSKKIGFEGGQQPY